MENYNDMILYNENTFSLSQNMSRRILICAACFVAGSTVAIYIYDRKPEPLYSLTIGIWHRIKKHPKVSTNQAEAKLQSRINSRDDAEKMRKLMIKTIWGDNKTYKSTINEYVSEKNLSSLKQAKSYYTTNVKMEHGINVKCHLFESKNTGNTKNLVIYHQGHGGTFAKGKRTIEKLMALKFDVLAMEMPLMGQNNKPTVTIDNIGKVKITNHNRLQLIKLKEGIPIKFFIEPVMRCKQAAIKKNGYEGIHMVGLSGGGWTTVLASAIDPEIKKSIIISGALPIALREYDLGDYEQYAAIELYSKVNYLDMFILGSYGKKRHQIQIFNVYDSCCFRGYRAKAYERMLKDKVNSLGSGKSSIIYDESHWSHKISNFALDIIAEELKTPSKTLK